LASLPATTAHVLRAKSHDLVVLLEVAGFAAP
jgi:hypothetical protein